MLINGVSAEELISGSMMSVLGQLWVMNRLSVDMQKCSDAIHHGSYFGNKVVNK